MLILIIALQVSLAGLKRLWLGLYLYLDHHELLLLYRLFLFDHVSGHDQSIWYLRSEKR